MYETHHDSGGGDTVHTPLSFENVEAFRMHGRAGTFTVTIGDVDLPAFISAGQLYVQAPLPLIFTAFAEDLPAFLHDMEARISDAWGTSFSLDSHGYPVSLAGLAEPRVVRSRRVRR